MQKLAYIIEYPISSWVRYELDALKKLGFTPLVCCTNPAGDRMISGALQTSWVAFSFAILTFFLISPMKFGDLFFRWKKEIGMLMFLRAIYLAHQLEKMQIKHIHAHFASGAGTVAYLINKISGISFSITTHAYDIFKNEISDSNLYKKLAKAEKIRCISQYNKSFLSRKFPDLPEQKFNVIHCGIDVERFKPVPVHNSKQFQLIAIANLVEKKGLIYLLKACKILVNRNIKFVCKIVGDGYERQELEQYIEQNKLGDFVFLTGRCSNQKINRTINKSKLLILPCIVARDGDRDGIPVTLMEAMASGVPVISTSISGIPELISNRVNGTLIPPANEIQMAGAIEELLSSDLLNSKYATEGRSTIVKYFNAETIASELLDFWGDQF